MGDLPPIAIGPGEGQTVENPAGGDLTFKARGEETAGALTLFDTTAAPGEGPPVHLHTDADEFVYVLDGELRFELGDEVHHAPAGSFLFIPRGVEHVWQNSGDRQARFLAGFTPASPGMERFFERAAELDDAERRPVAFAKFAGDAGMQVLGPPMADA
jgi:quercetin dioxygenase-like cupin family protein